MNKNSFKSIFCHAVIPFMQAVTIDYNEHHHNKYHNTGEDNCRIMEVGVSKRYLKKRCEGGYICPRSKQLYEIIVEESGCTQLYTTFCPEDPMFYQACGHFDQSDCISDSVRSSLMFCGTYVCKYKNKSWCSSGSDGKGICDGKRTCSNTKVDEMLCSQNYINCNNDHDKTIDKESICNGVCDCEYCEDEAVCNNHTYGIICSDGYIASAQDVCLDGEDSFCTDGEDQICPDEEIVRQCKSMSYAEKIISRSIYPNQICAVPNLNNHLDQQRTCIDGLDQINCSDSTRIVMTCIMDGYDTNISVYAICMGYDLCDNGYQNECTEPENGCVVHKGQLCDGKHDCPQGNDETEIYCSTLTTTKCIRAFNMTQDAKQFPVSWIMDGYSDCANGYDEDKSNWNQCGSYSLSRFSESVHECTDVFLCPRGEGFIEYSLLCDKIESCGKENLICENSKSSLTSWSSVLSSKDSHIKILTYCLEGLEGLHFLISQCVVKPYEDLEGEILGVSKISLKVPQIKQDCRNTFGELYVYLSCSDSCKASKCPLISTDQSSCINIPKDGQIFSLTEQYTVKMVRREKNQYFSDYFACKNKRCVHFDKVCNLVDDCGDQSDEELCTNHFYCKSSKEFVPLTSVCDGVVDCRDYTDECETHCSTSSQQLLTGAAIPGIAWTFGFFAVILNSVVVAKTSKSFMKSELFHHRIDKILIMLLSTGDLLMGLYLLGIALANFIHSTNYCTAKFIWLSSQYCSILGVCNTMASQISLFSMTALSISRLYNFKIMIPKQGNTRTAWIKLTTVAFFLIVTSFSVALVPLLHSLEDYFVNSLYYEGVTLFSGLVDKDTHQRVLQSYNTRFLLTNELSWQTIRQMTREMFSVEYGGVEGRTVGFYGNDGVCIFKYLVTKSDPQHIFSLGILLLNSICFVIITVCYILLSRSVGKISHLLGAGASSRQKMQNKLHAKVSFIIATDFACWIPFILVTIIHFQEIIDASHFYPLFSIIILPINSVVNPLLYEKAFEDAFARFINHSRIRFHSSKLMFYGHQNEDRLVDSATAVTEL